MIVAAPALVQLAGLPGSGKSTRARQLELPGIRVVDIDDHLAGVGDQRWKAIYGFEDAVAEGLDAGDVVLAVACFLSPWARKIADLAAPAPVHLLLLDVPFAVADERQRSRADRDPIPARKMEEYRRALVALRTQVRRRGTWYDSAQLVADDDQLPLELRV